MSPQKPRGMQNIRIVHIYMWEAYLTNLMKETSLECLVSMYYVVIIEHY